MSHENDLTRSWHTESLEVATRVGPSGESDAVGREEYPSASEDAQRRSEVERRETREAESVPSSENLATVRATLELAHERFGLSDATLRAAKNCLDALEQELAKYRDLCQEGDEDYLRVMAERDAAQAELAQAREALRWVARLNCEDDASDGITDEWGEAELFDKAQAIARRALADGEGTE